MVASFLEASVSFQTGDVLTMYTVIFVVLAVICGATYFSAMKTKVE